MLKCLESVHGDCCSHGGMETSEGSGIGAEIYDLGDGIWDLHGDEIGRG